MSARKMYTLKMTSPNNWNWILNLIIQTLTFVYSSHGYTYQSYQGTIKCTALGIPKEPVSITEVQEIVESAVKSGMKIKVIGNLHSATDVICTEGIAINMSRINHFRYDSSTKLATVGAGSDAMHFLENLHSVGRAVYGAPSFGGVSIGGAVSLGAHGTALTKQTTLSDQIASVLIVDGRGDIRNISKSTNEHLFRALRVGLGLLGVIVEVEFHTVEQYKIQFRNFPRSDDILRRTGEIEEIARKSDLFQFWWYPTNKQVVLSVGTRLPVSAPGTCETHLIPEIPKLVANVFSTALEVMQSTSDYLGYFLVETVAKMSLYRYVPGRTPTYSETVGKRAPCLPEATGYSHRMMANECNDCAWNQSPVPVKTEITSVTIPLSELTNALKTMSEILEQSLTEFPPNGIYVRFLTPSDAYMATNHGQEMVNIGWISIMRHHLYEDAKFGLAGYQALAQALVVKHRGRPHWGKNGLYFLNPLIIRQAHPEIDRFIDAMRELDPFELFMNPFGRRVKYGSFEMNLTPQLQEHCALNDVCLCREDKDCGKANGNLECGKLGQTEFTVCKKRSNLLTDLFPNQVVPRTLLNTLADTINLINNEDVTLRSIFDFLKSRNRNGTFELEQILELRFVET